MGIIQSVIQRVRWMIPTRDRIPCVVSVTRSQRKKSPQNVVVMQEQDSETRRERMVVSS